MEIGESFVGTGGEAAHLNTVLGERDGPVGQAWATALASPSAGHAPFVVVLQPGLPVVPFTLFVNKARVEDDNHARMTWGAAQAGVAAGVADAVAAGTIDEAATAGLVLIAAVWVDPAARDADLVFANNREATAGALALGRAGLPHPGDVAARREAGLEPVLPAGLMQELDDEGTRAVVAVQRLQAAYGDAVTRRAWGEVQALFEPEAVVHIDTRSREPFTLVGPGAVVEFIDRALEPYVFFEFAILNSVVQLDGDQASGRVYIGELRHARSGEWTQAFGLYQDRYTRRDGAWRIAERRYSSLARTGPTIESFRLPPT